MPLPEPDQDRWQEQLREWLLGVRGVFQRHPGVAALTLGRVPTGVNVVRWAEWTLVLLRGAGIPDRVAAYAGDLLGLYLGATGYEATMPPMTVSQRRAAVAGGERGHDAAATSRPCPPTSSPTWSRPWTSWSAAGPRSGSSWAST